MLHEPLTPWHLHSRVMKRFTAWIKGERENAWFWFSKLWTSHLSWQLGFLSEQMVLDYALLSYSRSVLRSKVVNFTAKCLRTIIYCREVLSVKSLLRNTHAAYLFKNMLLHTGRCMSSLYDDNSIQFVFICITLQTTEMIPKELYRYLDADLNP